MDKNYKASVEALLSQQGEGAKCTITRTQELSGEGAYLCEFTFDGEVSGTSACIVYFESEINTLMTLNDWQGSYPENESEIEDYEWFFEGRKAIMLNGLPRVML